MVVTYHTAHSPAGVGEAVSALLEVSTQRELLVVDTVLEISGCRECLVSLPEARRDGLLSSVLLLQSCTAKWRSYGKKSASEMMREVDMIFLETLWLQEPQTPAAVNTQAEFPQQDSKCKI